MDGNFRMMYVIGTVIIFCTVGEVVFNVTEDWRLYLVLLGVIVGISLSYGLPFVRDKINDRKERKTD